MSVSIGVERRNEIEFLDLKESWGEKVLEMKRKERRKDLVYGFYLFLV